MSTGIASTTVDVKLRLTEEMWGTVPMDEEVFKTYIESKKPEDLADEDESTTLPTQDDLEKKGTTGFHKDENGVFIYDYMVKGFLKNAANILKDQLGVKAMRNKVGNYVFVSPRRIHVGKEKADGIVERPLRAQTMQGPRVSLARSEKINAGTELSFSLEILDGPIKVKHIEDILHYGKFQGLGQNRGGGYGAFEVVDFIVRG